MKKILISSLFVLGIAFSFPFVATSAELTWTPRESNRSWYGLASSADGTKLAGVVFGGMIYTSTDSGATWTPRASVGSWVSIASSADGTRLVALARNKQIHVSSDSGATWTVHDSIRQWNDVTSSADGTKLAAVVNGGMIYTSSDSGVTWTPRESSRWWYGITSSADGTKLVAVGNFNVAYVSTDSGVTWTPRAMGEYNWRGVASSDDGVNLAAVSFGNKVFTSNNSGLNWTPRGTSANWEDVAISADGARITAVASSYNPRIYVSTDSGLTWTQTGPTGTWQTVASSADGRKLIAGIVGGQLYTSTDSTGAVSDHNVSGYAWSSNIGWVSFNCANDNSCGAADYGVDIDPLTSEVSGYAWSPYIGWIQFGGLSGFPSGPGTSAVNARMSGTRMIGWARAISAENDGWDGWISLGGTGYDVSLSGSTLVGYAWGSSVVGWLSFDVAGPTLGVTVNETLPSVAFDVTVGGSSVSGTSDVTYGSIASLTATVSDLPIGTTCSVSKTSVGGTALSPNPSASSSVSWVVETAALTGPTDYEYTLACDNGAGYSASQTVSFSVMEIQPEFSVGGPEEVGIQFVRSGSADSELKTITIYPTMFTGDVNIALGGISPAMHASTTILYSIGGGTFSANPDSVNVSSSGATTFRIRLSRPIENICDALASGNPVGCVDYYITLNATDTSGQGAPATTKVYRINQTPVDAKYKEI